MREQREPAFADRRDAGRDLADALTAELPDAPTAGLTNGLPEGADVVVLALPRGGVPVAAPVAAALRAPLDVLVVRKLGLPAQPELAMGAIAGVEGHVEIVRNDGVVAAASVPRRQFDGVLAAETVALREREARYRAGPPVAVEGRTVVLVDDGLATGSTMRAAVAALGRRRPGAVVVAVPVGAPPTCAALEDEFARSAEPRRLVCLRRPADFRAVGQAYVDFSATADDEVRTLLADARSSRS